jgi:hypothetical protein
MHRSSPEVTSGRHRNGNPALRPRERPRLEWQGGAKSGRRKLFYTGTATQYTNKRFEHETHHQYSIVSYGVTGNASRGVPLDHSARRPSSFGRKPAPSVTRRRDSSGPRSGQRASTTSSCIGRREDPQHLAKRCESCPPPALGHAGRSGSGRGRMPAVLPAFGPQSRTHYGNLLGQSGFRVG